MRPIDADALKAAAQTVRETTDAFCELIDAQETMNISTIDFKEDMKMINVTCKVNNEDKNGPIEITVTSVDKGYNLIDLKIGESTARVFGGDLIQAIENCMQSGRRRYVPYRRADDEE